MPVLTQYLITFGLVFALVYVTYIVAYRNGYAQGTRDGIVTISRFSQEVAATSRQAEASNAR